MRRTSASWRSSRVDAARAAPRRLLTAACAVVASLGLLTAADAGAQVKKKDKEKDQDVARYLKQLMARFEAWDRNNDNILDKSELARAFRGAGAKPFDYQPDRKLPPARERALMLYTGLFSARASLTLSNLLVAQTVELRAPPDTTPPPKITNPNLYPDYQFLVVAGNKGQTRLTRKEFESWARSYARMLDEQEEAQKNVQQAQGKAAKAKNEKMKAQAQAELQKYGQQLQAVSAQLNAIPPGVHKALNVKR